MVSHDLAAEFARIAEEINASHNTMTRALTNASAPAIRTSLRSRSSRNHLASNQRLLNVSYQRRGGIRFLKIGRLTLTLAISNPKD